MKNSFLLAILALLPFFSCVNGPVTVKKPVNDTCHIEQFYHKFMARYPDGLDNDIKSKRMNEQFVAEITDSLKNSNWLISDYPIRFKSIKEWKNGTCLVHFQSWIKPDNFSFKDFDFHEFAFDIIAEVPEKYAETLKDDNFYIIHGKLDRFITHQEFTRYTDDYAYTPRVGISKEIGPGSRVNMELGEMFFQIDSISPYGNGQ